MCLTRRAALFLFATILPVAVIYLWGIPAVKHMDDSGGGLSVHKSFARRLSSDERELQVLLGTTPPSAPPTTPIVVNLDTLEVNGVSVHDSIRGLKSLQGTGFYFEKWLVGRREDKLPVYDYRLASDKPPGVIYWGSNEVSDISLSFPTSAHFVKDGVRVALSEDSDISHLAELLGQPTWCYSRSTGNEVFYEYPDQELHFSYGNDQEGAVTRSNRLKYVMITLYPLLKDLGLYGYTNGWPPKSWAGHENGAIGTTTNTPSALGQGLK